MIKAIIFDLDNCLSPAEETGRDLLKPVFDAVRRSNQGTLTDEMLEQAFSDCWHYSFDLVARKYQFSEEMLAAGWEKGVRLEVTSRLRGYPDISVLPELSVLRFLVTSGFRRLQQSKITALEFSQLFEGIYIDAIDEEPRKGKQRIFQDILSGYALNPTEVLIVGDDPNSEIEIGNNLGLKTAQILRPGVQRGNNAMYHINNLAELKLLIMEA